PAAFSAAIVLMRAMSRRTWRTRAVFSSWPVAFWRRRLNCSFFSLASSSLNWSGLIPRASSVFMAKPFLFRDALHEARLDRELGGAETQRLAGGLLVNAVELEHDTARLHPARPEIDGALALAHAHFGRLARYRNVRENADPDTALALHLA